MLGRKGRKERGKEQQGHVVFLFFLFFLFSLQNSGNNNSDLSNSLLRLKEAVVEADKEASKSAQRSWDPSSFFLFSSFLFHFFLLFHFFFLSSTASPSLKMTLVAQLFEAIERGRVDKAERLLLDNPGLDVNWRNEEYLTSLHRASFHGHTRVVKLPLEHPAINVNLQDNSGRTPLLYACLEGYKRTVLLFLKDLRVNISVADRNDCTPVWWAVYFGHFEVVEWFIASGRCLGDHTKKGKYGVGKYTNLEIARKRNQKEGVSLLERFVANPKLTRLEILRKLGLKMSLLDELAAEVFALTVFLCDDLLQRKPTLKTAATIAAARFFGIATTLPMELQMILCHRVVGSMKQSVVSEESEVAFKALARVLQHDQTSIQAQDWKKTKSTSSCSIS